MLGLGTGELLIILGLVVLVFGASRLPQLGEGMGKALRGFKKAVNEDSDATPLPEPASKREPDRTVPRAQTTAAPAEKPDGS